MRYMHGGRWERHRRMHEWVGWRYGEHCWKAELLERIQKDVREIREVLESIHKLLKAQKE